MSPYSLAVKQEAVRKTLHRESGRTIAQMADELNVPYHSLRKWLQDSRMSDPTAPQPTEKRATEYSAEQRLQAVLDTVVVKVFLTGLVPSEARSIPCFR